MSSTIGIIGASGYTGAELLRLVARHPELKLTTITAESQAGKRVTELYPHLHTYSGLTFAPLASVSQELASCDVIVCGLPHGESMTVLPQLKNKLVVDLGSDFRLHDSKLYPQWYSGKNHSCPDQITNWTYGLTELFREEIRRADRIANPGCYATAIGLALAPLVKQDLIESPAVVDAMSGTTGGGRAAKDNLTFSHVFEDLRAYKVGKHQHTPEIEQAIGLFSKSELKLSFTAHLVPMSRGILATCSAPLKSGVTAKKLRDALQDAYAHEYFVKVIAGESPGTKEIRGSNFVSIGVNADQRTGRAIVVSAIDNLVKGASGQALQNINLCLGLPETLGLTDLGLYP